MGNQSIVEELAGGICRIKFSSPKGNSLDSTALENLALTFDRVGSDPSLKVICLESAGDSTFCAGASFDELAAVHDRASGKRFFSGFGRLILSMIRCPKIIITKIQGKAVGGGVGLAAASDFVLASEAAQFRLSELAIGLGPFVIGPVVEHKVGRASFIELALGGEWRDAAWGYDRGLVQKVTKPDNLERVFNEEVQRFSNLNVDALRQMKKIIWEGTESWEQLLFARADISGQLTMGDFVKNTLLKMKK